MMCEHEHIFVAVNYPVNPEQMDVVCLDCNEFIGKPGVMIYSLRQQLAAANARVKELESKCETCFDNYAKVTGKLTVRAEQAEAQAAYFRSIIKRHLCKISRYERCRFVDECDLNWACKAYYAKDSGSVLLARMERMREAMEALIGLCENGADFRNGNVCQGIDEGNVMAGRVIEEAKAALEKK